MMSFSKGHLRCLEQAAGYASPRVVNVLIRVIKIRAGDVILFTDSKTSVELHAQPRGKILIASLGEEMAPHESLKERESYNTVAAGKSNAEEI